MKRTALTLTLCVASLTAMSAFAGTPTFVGSFDRMGIVEDVPVSFPADQGTFFVSADESRIAEDVTCDSLSTHALYVTSGELRPGFEVRFVHEHGLNPGGPLLIAERETFTLKMGVEKTDAYTIKVGFTSEGGFQENVAQFGPASSPDAPAGFGEIYVYGEPSGVLFGNVLESKCSGPNRLDTQVNLSFDMLGEDGIFFVTLGSNAPYPQRNTLGPFVIPEAVLEEGYGACMISGKSGCGTALVDEAECLAATVHELLPINGNRRTHLDPTRR